MEWNVYYHDFNKDEIRPYNVLGGSYYKDCIKKLKKKSKTKEDFSELLRREMMYHFWSRSEWELIIEITEDNRIFLNPWCGCRNPENTRIDVTEDNSFNWREFALSHINKQRYKNEAKIDVYDQLYFVWDDFVNYCWNSKGR